MLAGRPQRAAQGRIYTFLLKRRCGVLVRDKVLARDEVAERYSH